MCYQCNYCISQHMLNMYMVFLIGYPEQAYPGPGGYGGEPGNTWRPQPSYTAAPTQQGFPQPVAKKTYITDPPASLVPPVHLAPQKVRTEPCGFYTLGWTFRILGTGQRSW
jgi:hypothetical protein